MTAPQPGTSRDLLDHPDLVALGIKPLLDAFRRRWIAVRLFEFGLLALAAGLGAFIVFDLVFSIPQAWLWSAAASLVLMAAAGVVILVTAAGSIGLAPAADRALGLDAQISSTIELYRYGLHESSVARALRALTGSAIAATPAGTGHEPYLTARRKGLLAVLAALILTLAVTMTWSPAASPEPLSAADIAQLADILAAEAARTGDDPLAEIAGELEDLAVRAPQKGSDAPFAADLRETLQRASNRFGSNRDHNFPPFESASSDLMERVENFMAQGGAPALTPASAPVGAGVDAPAEELASDNIRAMDLGGGDDSGTSLGLEPQEGQGSDGLIEDEENSSDLDQPMPQMGGQAEGSGTGQTDMAGTGEADEVAASLDALPAPGFAETEEITANQREDGATTRVGMEVDATPTGNSAPGTSRRWALLDAVPVERIVVPPTAREAVSAYFIRNLETAP